jgi:hypothetical protein
MQTASEPVFQAMTFDLTDDVQSSDEHHNEFSNRVRKPLAPDSTWS